MYKGVGVRTYFCLRRSRRKHLCRNSDNLYLVVYSNNFTVSITVVCMGTKQFNDKTTHRQQANHRGPDL